MSVTVASIVRNEADRFLPAALDIWGRFADRIVVLDDGSTDETPEILRNAGVEAHFGPQAMLGCEWKARKRLFELATEGSEWVLWYDSDQIPASDPRPHLKTPVVGFRVFDLWSEDTYRSDAWWKGHERCWWRGVHVPSVAGTTWRWNERAVHCGHVPQNLPPANPMPVECSVLHYAYSSPALREQKAKMYNDLAEHLTPKERFHAGTILSEKPVTRPLPFTPEWRL